MFITASIAIVGGALFQWIGFPIPWLLGPMFAVMLAARSTRVSLRWHSWLRNAALMSIGYVIGRSLTTEALITISGQFWLMLFFTSLLVALCIGIAYAVHRFTGTDSKTALLGSIPGGMMQALAMAEETKGVDVGVVTITQTVRLLIIIIGTPLIAVSLPTAAVATNEPAMSSAFLLYIIAICAGAFIGVRVKLPTAYMLGPAIATIIVQVCGVPAPPLPDSAINAAQLAMGITVGLLVTPSHGRAAVKTVLTAIVAGTVLFISSIALSFAFYALADVSFTTALLALVPGGLDQLSMVAHALGADLAIVSGFQIFRLFFVLLVVPFIMKGLFTQIDKKSE